MQHVDIDIDVDTDIDIEVDTDIDIDIDINIDIDRYIYIDIDGFSFVMSKDEQKWPKWSKVIEFPVPRVMAAGQMYLVAQNWNGISLVYTGIYLYQYIPIFIYLQLQCGGTRIPGPGL